MPWRGESGVFIRSGQVHDRSHRRIEHVHSSVRRCRIVKDRSRLWKPGLRDGTLLCAAQRPGAPAPLAANGLIGINSVDLRAILP